MNLHKSVAAKMEYIQKVFLQTQEYMQTNKEPEDVIAFLDSEPPEFRSVAYEAASMEIALQELGSKQQLNEWKNFYHRSANAHTFHMDIGLGWAFAKTEISPTPFLPSLQNVIPQMVFDGIGHYYGLFKGRRTVKSQLVSDDISDANRCGFDQGLGRRLWYISKGEVIELNKLIEPFNKARQADLWRGVGIACGYVGGSDQSTLQQLLDSSTEFKNQLSTGIALAAISRNASNSVTTDIELACKVVCGKAVKDVVSEKTLLYKQFNQAC